MRFTPPEFSKPLVDKASVTLVALLVDNRRISLAISNLTLKNSFERKFFIPLKQWSTETIRVDSTFEAPLVKATGRNHDTLL